jgi:hypothetical protein
VALAACSLFALETGLSAQDIPDLLNCTGSSSGNPCVLTGQYNNQRTAYNSNETALTATTVGNSGTKLLQQKMLFQVDPVCSGCSSDTPNIQLPWQSSMSPATFNPIYAQPLNVPGASVQSPANTGNCNDGGSGKCNMLIAVTMNDTVFAWNAITGNLLWSRQGYPGRSPGTGNALYYDDCGPSATSVVSPEHLAVYFEGIVSTPVIDTTLSPPTMFLPSLCKVSGGTIQSFLHAVDITKGSDIAHVQVPTCPGTAGSDGADLLNQGGCPTGTIEFLGGHERQRAALLETNSSLYIAYGTRVPENNASSYPYDGWVFSYAVPLSASSTPAIAFDTTAKGVSGNTDSPAPCDISQTVGGTGEYQNEPNWCSHGSGIWMSGRGPAASNGTLVDGNTHIFLGSGNGGFQQNGQNWGESIMDFRNGNTTDSSPFQSFTPYGGVAIQPPLAVTTCSSGGPCAYTFEALNENDWDMAVSGVLLYNDANSKPWLVSIDKAGFGYLLEQGSLCGAAKNGTLSQCDVSGLVQSFATTDPGNKFPFQASHDTCIGSGGGPQNTDCDRIASMAFYNNGTNSYLYYWPTNFATGNDERLVALQLSNNSAISPTIAPTITTDSTGTIVHGSGTTFTSWVIPGDQLTANSQTVTVTAVTSDTQLTVSPAFTPISTGVSFTYNGYFVNPARDFTPPPYDTGYAGGSLVVTSSSPESSDGVVWAVIPANDSATGLSSSTGVRTPGTLYAYRASPVSSPSWGLQRLWDSTDYCTNCQTFCVSSFALPTVANGLVFVPIYSINQTSDTTQLCPTDTTQDTAPWQTGILAYGH